MTNAFVPPAFARSPVPLVAATLTVAMAGLAEATRPTLHTLQGTVATAGDVGLDNYEVSLYASFADRGPLRLGSGATDGVGRFQIAYALPPGLAKRQPVLVVKARRGLAMLASAIGTPSNAPASVVVNERTTVATANAFAQFIDGRKIEGNTSGMTNAVSMAANLADPRTGGVGTVLASSPNGTETSTFATFNALSNAVAGCVADAHLCARLFAAATPPSGPPPGDVLQALANIVRHPSYPGYPADAEDPLFELSQAVPAYRPALTRRPTNWLLFVKFTGGFYSAQASTNLMNGPGNIAIDANGFAWVNDNYVPQPAERFACAGRRLLKFHPWGENFPGSPYFGGGLSGAGYGITLDPGGRVWVGNFGFQDPPCLFRPSAATNDSVSAFRPDGTALSPPRGYTAGNISWPQATVSDRSGDIWVANCGNDSVTVLRQGKPGRALNIALGPTPAAGRPQIKPFGAVVDLQGRVWVTGNRSHTVSILSPQGRLIETLPGTYRGRTVLSHPIGNAADSRGNVWVANSDWLDAPCPTRARLGSAANPSIAMYRTETRRPHPGSPFTGGGITLPWGIAVDGNDTVWVFNFGAIPPGTTNDVLPTAISRFCGADTRQCPPGMRVGDPMSPATGYTSDALERITGGQVDRSGNIWLVNNWKRDADPFKNPGGNAIVIVVGAAGPLKTPLLGPPVPFR